MKKNLFLFIILAMLSISVGQIVSIDNGQVEVVVHETTGMFAIGGVGGMPVVEGYPDDPSHTHFCVRVNNQTYCNKSGLGDYDLILFDPAEVYGNTISIQWHAGPYRVWEKFYTLDFDSLRGFIYIELLFVSEIPSDTATVGFLLCLDARVGDNDDPTIYIPGMFIENEVSFSGGLVPAYWTFYRNYGDTICDVAQGVPFGIDMLYADFVAFSDVAYASNATWAFPTSGRPINDLAFLVRWDVDTVLSYRTYRTGIYYGLGYPGTNIDELLANNKPLFVNLGHPYPNPANSHAKIDVEVFQETDEILVDVVGLDGRQVITLFEGRAVRGTHSIFWDLRDMFGSPVSSGVYLIRLFAKMGAFCKPIAVIK